jgi:hypothetical protein
VTLHRPVRSHLLRRDAEKAVQHPRTGTSNGGNLGDDRLVLTPGITVDTLGCLRAEALSQRTPDQRRCAVEVAQLGSHLAAGLDWHGSYLACTSSKEEGYAAGTVMEI